MVKISCPKCEDKKFTFFLMERGNVPGAIMNLHRTGFLSILRGKLDLFRSPFQFFVDAFEEIISMDLFPVLQKSSSVIH